MSMAYENQRVHFDEVLKKYLDYVELYKLLNGAVEGVTPFSEYYWRLTYLSKYEDPEMIGSQGY